MNLVQLICFHAHDHGHTLELVITSSECAYNPQVECLHASSSDHYPIVTTLTTYSLLNMLREIGDLFADWLPFIIYQFSYY